MKKCWCLLSIVLLLSACGKNDLSLGKNDSLILAIGNGWCGFNCNTAYKITDKGAFASIPDPTLYNDLKFQTSAVDNNFYQQLKSLRDEFPSLLSKSPDQNYGCAGCTDGDYLYIQLNRKNSSSQWSLDLDTSKIPADLRVYCQKSYQIIKD